jgi:diaminohydroxyphosphoribosylaminopyrimidine deaminase/5-amino-6-(5-phosphoribosylamino)uracil reductase
MAAEQANGATAYVTLEPCSHHGRTPPCAEGLIASKVARVVVATVDPNPLVAGNGLAKLRAAGIAVEMGLMAAEARALNVGFFSRMERRLPYVRSKIATSLDGRTALANGKSQWITGAEARRDGHRWRARSCAVLTGIETILADDAQLSVRDIDTSRQPLRVVLDSQLRMPLAAKILVGDAVVIVTASSDSAKISALEKLGAQVLVLPNADGQVDLLATLSYLTGKGCNEVLVEAGRTLNGAFLKAGLVDELLVYLAPQLLGDCSRGMAQLGELTELQQRVELVWQDVRQVGHDLRIIATIKRG